MGKQRIFFCIDMKSFFASVECVERGLDPFKDNLIVCDLSRGNGTICLAVSPKMKTLGVKNRCRLFEIPKDIEYVSAKPRMKKYIEYAAKIHSIYLDYVDKNDIHVYSIDESFIDVTDYIKLYNFAPREFAKILVDDIKKRTGIPATVGIGTNMYLAKIALDITAKKSPNFIGFLDEREYRATLWHHKPLTDFWQVAKGIEKRLERMGIRDMYDITRFPEKLLYKEFGINAELLIDHAWGKESCTIKDIKGYKSKAKSISSSQILFEDYPFDKARIVVAEMIRDSSYDLLDRKLVTNRLNVLIGYSKDVIPWTKIHVRIPDNTNLSSVFIPYVLEKFDELVDRNTPIRKIGVEFIDVLDHSLVNYGLFCDYNKVKKESDVENTALSIKERFGKSAIIRGSDLQEGATALIRHKLVGGHNGE